MEIKTIAFYDALTNEMVEREMNLDELAEHEAMQDEAAERQAEAEAKVAAKKSALAKLKKLGLTDKEIAAL